MRSPGLTAIPASGGTTSADTPETLIRDARLLLQACGIDRSQSWVSRTVRAYHGSAIRGLPFGHFLAARLELGAQQRAELHAHPEYRYVLEYADPVGETAVGNVMREQGRR